MNRLIALAVATAVVIVASVDPGVAQTGQDKPLTPQQQKMKACAIKWKDEKAKTSVRGREAYRTFLSSCLKAAA